jgi:hypothetical protein
MCADEIMPIYASPFLKNLVSCVIGILLVIDCHHIMIGSITFLQTSCSKLFSVACFENLPYSLVSSRRAL